MSVVAMLMKTAKQATHALRLIMSVTLTFQSVALMIPIVRIGTMNAMMPTPIADTVMGSIAIWVKENIKESIFRCVRYLKTLQAVLAIIIAL